MAESITRGSGRRLNRRTFLKLAGLAGIGGALAVLRKVSEPAGTGNTLRWASRDAALQIFGRPAVVGLVRCPSYQDSLEALREAWSTAEMPLIEGKRILIKPNLIDSIEGHPVNTAPEVVAALLKLTRELGAAEVAVGDGPGFRREAESVARSIGLMAVCATHKAPFVDLNYDDPKPVLARDGWFRTERSLWLPRHVREADLIISTPKLKTHHWAGVSLSLKNLFGVIPGCRYGWPKNMLHMNTIPLSILGVYQTVRPVLAVVDGVVGMEGDGPLFGVAVEHGMLVVSRDPVAADTVSARLMGYALSEIDYLELAGATGVGQTEKIEVRGADESALGRVYARPPASL